MQIKISAFLVVKAELGLVLCFRHKKKPPTEPQNRAHPHSITQLLQALVSLLTAPPGPALDLEGADRAQPLQAGRSPGRPARSRLTLPPTPTRVSQEWGGAGGPGEPH